MNPVKAPEGFRPLAAEYHMLPRGARVLCAVSGGADSMCLLHLLSQLAPEGGFSVTAAHFNHGLRGEEALRDESFVREQCARWGIPLTVGRGDVRPFAAREGLSIEEAARTLRYAFLEQAAASEGCTRIATAHNAGDNLETLLLHLVRGTGLQGLAGIPPRRGNLVRPLLRCSREEILAYLETYHVPHVEDSTNAQLEYTRNKLRHQVLPVLRQLNPRVEEGAANTIRYLRADNDYLNAEAARSCAQARWVGGEFTIDAACLASLPDALAPRAARRLLELAGGGSNYAAAHLNAVIALARGDSPSARAALPNGLLARRVYGELRFTFQNTPPPPFQPVPVTLDGETCPQGAAWALHCRPVCCPDESARTPGAFYVAQGRVSGPLELRPRRTGDRISLPRRGGGKTVKKLFIDEKIPRQEREQIPILADPSGVIALAGFGPEAGRLAQPGEAAYELIWKKKESV